MELPEQLKNLYRHWKFHTSSKIIDFPDIIPAEMRAFIAERLKIWQKKMSGENPPFTDDSILNRYRFCNIFREFDRQTIEFHTLLNPTRDNFALWLLNMFYCRVIARPETINNVGMLSFNENENDVTYRKLIVSSRPRFGTPYVFPISVIQRGPTPTRELFLTKHLPKIMTQVAREVETWDKKTVYDGVQKILPIFGYNLFFLWTEVLIDTAYQFPGLINLFGRFPVGPGSLPTFKKIAPSINPSLLMEQLGNLRISTDITFGNSPLALSAENWEGIGCEFRKYTNLSSGKGRKRLYAIHK